MNKKFIYTKILNQESESESSRDFERQSSPIASIINTNTSSTEVESSVQKEATSGVLDLSIKSNKKESGARIWSIENHFLKK